MERDFILTLPDHALQHQKSHVIQQHVNHPVDVETMATMVHPFHQTLAVQDASWRLPPADRNTAPNA